MKFFSAISQNAALFKRKKESLQLSTAIFGLKVKTLVNQRDNFKFAVFMRLK
jgi:hypothetical protein